MGYVRIVYVWKGTFKKKKSAVRKLYTYKVT